MKQLPDVFTSTIFWSSIATIGAASGAWFTYFSAATSSRQQTHDSILNLITGIEAEFNLISLWASGGDKDTGYSQSGTKQELTAAHPDWFHPSRQIFTFDTPSLHNFTTAAQLRRLSQIVTPLVRLNYSIRRLFDLHNELRTFANSHPDLFNSVSEKLAKTPTFFTQEEQVYMNIIFGFNLRIHQKLIGGTDSTDDLCLYKAFRGARDAVDDFKQHAKPEVLPRWYLGFHMIAGMLGVLGIWEVVRWLHGVLW